MKNFLFIFFICSTLIAQVVDSAKAVIDLPDSTVIAADSLSATTDTLQNKSFDVDAIIFASSDDSLSFDIQNKKMNIFGKGEIKYKATQLNSGKILLDFPSNKLYAEGIPDTSDTNGNKIVQTPVLSEKGEKYDGRRINYNFKTQRGFISVAKSGEEGQRYEGTKVKKVDKDVYFIEDGIYTTCESDTPHTHFTASKMKVIPKDKIIAQWVFLHIGGVPLPVPLPFGVFPNQTGRRSGIIAPTYGQSALQGQFFKGGGYFWALSDYMDLAITGDYYSKGGWGMASRYRYAKRYDLNGNINFGYTSIKQGEGNDPGFSNRVDWNLAVYHHQNLTPTAKLDVNLQFLSSDYLKQNSTVINDQLKQDIISNATFSKSWSESGMSMSINYSRTQNLATGNLYENLPSLSFNKTISYPFKSENPDGSKESWYEKIGYSYSGQFLNKRNKVDGHLNVRGGINNRSSISASPKIGYISVTPRVNLSSKWYNKRIRNENFITQQDINGQLTYVDSVVTNDVKEINAVNTFDLSLSASTKLYGIANVNNFGVEAFRHTISPSVSYNYNPDFSKNNWGYYDEYKKADGTIVRYDKFGKEVFGGVSASESQSVNFSLGNIFEFKTLNDPTDTTSEAKKIRLLNLDFSTGYNFAADSLRLRDLSISYRTQITSIFDLSGSSRFTFYDFNDTRKVDEYLVSKGKGLMRLTNFNFSVSTTLAGSKDKDEKRDGTQGKDNPDDEYASFKKKDYIDFYEEEPPNFSIPWNLSLSYNYNLSKPNPSDPFVTSTLTANLGFNLTQYWKFTVRGSYDMENKQVTAPAITVYRDLHCWEFNFNWNPIGTFRGFRFELRLKAPQLQDLKVTKSKGLYTGRR